VRGNFFELVDRAVALRMMSRPRGKLAIAHGAQLTAHGRFRQGYSELFEEPLAKVDDPPTHDAMDRRLWAVLDDARERGAMFVLEKGRLPRRFTIDKAIRVARQCGWKRCGEQAGQCGGRGEEMIVAPRQ